MRRLCQKHDELRLSTILFMNKAPSEHLTQLEGFGYRTHRMTRRSAS
jgi:hypothetical protein